jgi:cell division protein FtsL
MSRSSAATAAGRARAVRRASTTPVPRRVSGPAAPNRRDDDRPRTPRLPRARIDAGALAYGDGGVAARAPRARIDAGALAYADAVVAPAPLVAPRPRPRTHPAPRPQRLAYGGVAIASRMAGVAVDVSASRLMDRLARSRVWIGLIAFVLIGLVAMQVSLLKLNAGIGRAVETVSTLERSNAALRSEVSRLSAGERIASLAASKDLVMPAPADVTYLRGRDSSGDAARAARRMRAPDPLNAGLAGAVIDGGLLAHTGIAGTTATPGTTAPAPALAQTATPAVTPPPTSVATTTPAAGTAPAPTPAAATPAPAAAPPAATSASSGGALPQATPPGP